MDAWTNDRVMDKARELFELARRVAAHTGPDDVRREYEPTVTVFGPKANQFNQVDRALVTLLAEKGSFKEVVPTLLRGTQATHALWIAEAWIRTDAGKREALMGIVLGPRLEVHLRAVLGEKGFETPDEYRVPIEEAPVSKLIKPGP